ncbi:MAG: hypothetical protein BYD32DRAFT_484266 [Podila humilis]|nr:MAG: hypothetical protein BYD32DRAFT_484266 [Podila humilis]
MGITEKDIDDEFQKLIDELNLASMVPQMPPMTPPMLPMTANAAGDAVKAAGDAANTADDAADAAGDAIDVVDDAADAADDAADAADDAADAADDTNDAVDDAPIDTTGTFILTAAQQFKLMQKQKRNMKEQHYLLLQAIKDSLFADPFLEQLATSLKIPDDQRLVIDGRGRLVFLLRSYLYTDWHVPAPPSVHGLTKDIHEEWVILNGVPVCLIDVPGLFDSDDRETQYNVKKLTKAQSRDCKYKLYHMS